MHTLKSTIGFVSDVCVCDCWQMIWIDYAKSLDVRTKTHLVMKMLWKSETVWTWYKIFQTIVHLYCISYTHCVTLRRIEYVFVCSLICLLYAIVYRSERMFLLVDFYLEAAYMYINIIITLIESQTKAKLNIVCKHCQSILFFKLWSMSFFLFGLNILIAN